MTRLRRRVSAATAVDDRRHPGGKSDDRYGDHDTDHRARSTSATAGIWRRCHSVRSAAAVDNRRAKRAGHMATRLAISTTPATTAARAATGYLAVSSAPMSSASALK